MKLINNRWVDENNNSWSADIETEESALKKSQSLINCSDCSDCSDCRACSDCSDCRACSYCSDYKTNPKRYVTSRIGSRNAQTYAYWTTKDDTQIICGCWKGNIEQFEQRVNDVHKDSEHLAPYMKEINIMKYLINQ
jgi:hypothetical protein